MSRIRLVPAVVGALLLTGCADRPAAETLADAIVRAADQDPTVDLDAEQARCIAEHLLASGLSDTTLEGLAENFDSPEVLSAEVDQVEPAIADAALDCITGG
jgi:PBP1b-binding outer membrane lipoprotein LpoB